jgi:hypothetical protein
MKTFKALIFAVMVIGINVSCSANTQKADKTTQVSQSEKVEVYYFHFTRRCATCNAVEDVTQKALSELYGNEVSFSEYNLDKESGKSKGKELDVSGQTLIIVAGDTKINITNEGFMNARSNPEKLKGIIKEKIDPLL